MSSKRVSDFDEWKKIIGTLSPTNFEHLCYQLVKSMSGFYNVDLRDGSSDSGRDIDAQYRSIAPDGATHIDEKWRFECKRYTSGISFDIISGKILQANANRIDKLVIMSNMHLTPQCKDEISKTQNNFYSRVLDWAGVHFQDILFQFPHICEEFFPDEEIPKRKLDGKQSGELINITKRSGDNFGVKLQIKLKKGKPIPDNLEEFADIIKDSLLNERDIDLNIKSLVYQQMSSLFLSINRKEDALLFIEESLKITSKNEAALLHKGYILEKLDKIERSNRCYDAILKINKSNKFAFNNKAHNFRRNGNFEDALIFVNNALEIDSDFITSINNKISILCDLGKDDEALEFLNPILERHNDSRILILSKVSLLIGQLDLREAMRINNQLIEKNQNDLDAINNNGVIFEHNAKFKNPERFIPLAMECFQKVIDKDKDYVLGWANKIVCLINNNQIEDAEKIMNFIFDTFHSNSHILKEKGRIFMNKDDPKEALKFFNKSLKISVNRDVLIDKCYALLKLNKYKEIIEIADKNLLKYDSKDSDVWHLKGIALKKLHQNSRAQLCFEKEIEFKKIPKSLLE